MLRRPRSHQRDGVILLVVLAMLTIFALIGLGFVLYADSAATRARIFREAATFNRFGDVRETALTSATAAWEEFLGQILYDVNDDAVGVTSALRGHSLGRTLYGWNDAPGALNDRPYTGTGRLENPTQINYTYFQGQPIRDPARLGTRTDPNNLAARGPILGDLNVPYTYPDLNNVFLAMIDPATNQVIKPSYYRPEAISASGQLGALHYLPSSMSPAFPATVGNGHVKNLENLDGGNDSVWLDYGGSVHIAPDGRKYKCLVAPLIIDLDGRLNVNAAGNVLATGDTSASNMGWGAWEMNPARLSGPTAPPALLGEWRNLTLGNGTIQGRYGPGGLPLGQAFPGGTLLRRYAPVDLNGIVDPLSPGHRTPTPRYTFPGQGTTPAFVVFPGYDATAYGNAVPVETTTTGTAAGQSNHPASYNPITPIQINATNYNRVFSANDLAGILRRYNVGGESVPSDVINLLPNNLIGSGLMDPAARYRRGLLTTHSFDLDRPGGTPAIWDPTAAPYTATATGFPRGAAPTFPGLGLRGGPVPAHSEFDPNTWRSTLPPLRLNLARQLAAYPPVSNGRFDLTNPTVAQAVQQAQSDRQTFAREIFERLRVVVGARPVNEAAANPDEFRALRWIAQLAVNMVDYIDNDEYSTTFQWAPGEFVYGTELPRLVINEYYAQFDNERADLDNQMPERQQNFYRLNVWVELHNPMPSETAPSAAPEGGTVRLHNGTWAAYRLRLCRKPNANIRAAENTRGAPDPANVEANDANQQFVVDNWGGAAGNDATRTVAPNYGAYSGAANSNQGFYVVGPNPDYGAPLAMTNPGLAARRTWGEDHTLSIRIPAEGDPNATSPTSYDAANAPSLLLERLANPYLPPQDNPNAPLYNPYITVDYVAKLRVNEGRVTTKTMNVTPPPVAARHAYGKVHPFASFDTNDATEPVTRATALWQPANPVTPAVNEVLHTFMRHNAREDAGPPDPTLANQTLKLPFDVLHHPDRIPVSPAELLHVSWFKPHELTQQFMIGTFQEVNTNTPGHRFQHRAQWTNSETRLLRFLDHVSCGTYGAGVAPNGRLPGRVNLNTLWDRNVFAALVDAAAANHFTAAEVDTIFNSFFTTRTPGGVPASTDRIVLPSSAMQFAAATSLLPAPQGVESTLYRALSGSGSDDLIPRLFEPPANATWTNNAAIVARRQRLERFELLTKMANNVTTRSNVFALWATVGFFEVIDDTTQPVRLGAEMSWPGAGVIRHRMFAILDRSSMQVWPTLHPTSGLPLCRLGNAVAVTPGQEFSGTAQTVTLIDSNNNPISLANPLVNPNTNRQWIPQPGAIITVDPHTPNEETVVLEPDGMGGVRATFRRPHAAGTIVISRGNPGPWLRYDPTIDPEVVIYRTLIE